MNSKNGVDQSKELLSPEELKKKFAAEGKTFSGWAEERGYSRFDVYRVVNGQNKAKRGKGYKIAVELGLKSAPSEQITSDSYSSKVIRKKVSSNPDQKGRPAQLPKLSNSIRNSPDYSLNKLGISTPNCSWLQKLWPHLWHVILNFFRLVSMRFHQR